MPSEVPSADRDSGVFPILLGDTDASTEFTGAGNVIGLTNTVLLSTIYRLASHRVFFFGALAPEGQEATHNFVIEDVSNTLVLDSLTGRDQTIDVIQYLGFSDRFFADDLTSSLSLDSAVREAVVASATNVFSWLRHDDPFNEALFHVHNVFNTLTGTQSVHVSSTQDAENELLLSNVADSSGSTYDRDPTHSVIRQHLTYSIGGTDCPADQVYSPFVGSSPDTTYPAVSQVAPTLGANTLRLEFSPPFSPPVEIILRNPDFGDDYELLFGKIDRTTRGGDRKIYSDLAWAGRQSFRFRVKNLCDKDADAVISFLNAARGASVTLHDWENRQWVGVVTNETEVFQDEGGTTFDIVFENSLT